MLRKLIISVVVCAIALLCIVSGRLSAQKPAGDTQPVKQRVVYLQQNGGSHLMAGDIDVALTAEQADQVLPHYLSLGWRIARVDMTGSAGVQAEQIIGIVVLEK